MTLSLGAQVARDVVASSNALVNGGTIAVFVAFSGLAAIVARRFKAGTVIYAGAISAVASSALLAAAASRQSLPLYALEQGGSGIAYSLLLLSGLSLSSAAAPVTHRGATLSALLLVAYLAQALSALTLGRIATAANIAVAVDTSAIIVGILALSTLALNAVCRSASSRRGTTRKRT